MAFLFPPRPETAISPGLIQTFERKGYIGQRKKNGTLQVISTGLDCQVIFRTRHNEPNKAWTPTEEIKRHFANFPDSVFVGELLHSKHASVKNTIVLFDVLKYLGASLVGKTLLERLEILRGVHPLLPSVQLIDTYHEGLTGLFHSLSDPLDEGLVLKNPKAVLRDCMRNGLNSGWQVKVRKPHKNFSF